MHLISGVIQFHNFCKDIKLGTIFLKTSIKTNGKWGGFVKSSIDLQKSCLFEIGKKCSHEIQSTKRMYGVSVFFHTRCTDLNIKALVKGTISDQKFQFYFVGT